jgi:hypothetical protein
MVVGAELGESRKQLLDLGGHEAIRHQSSDDSRQIGRLTADGR